MSYLSGASADESKFPTLQNIKAEFGFIPNFYRAQTLRPDLIDAEAGLVGTILLKEGALTRRQKEYIFLTCSARNLSTYCVTAHCEMVRMLKLEGPEPEQIAIDHIHSKISIADKALLNFCSKLNSQTTKTGSSDIEALRTYGFSDPQILEAILLVGWAKFANTVAFGLGTVPDFENRRIAEELGKARAENRETPIPAVG